MKLSELSLCDLYKLKKYNKKEMKEYKMFTEHDRITNVNYLKLESNVFKIENAIEAFAEKIIY